MLELTVTDIKQYVYCPRIVYFTYVCPVDKKVSRKMEYGKEEHLRLDKLEKRRTLKRYNFSEGERLYHLRMYSPRLGLRGKLDICLLVDNAYFPVEFKYSGRQAGLNHKYQLVSYAMLLEEHFNCTVRYGLVYLTLREEVTQVRITWEAREFVNRILAEIRSMVATERMPNRCKYRGRCRDCEYRNFCGDVG